MGINFLLKKEGLENIKKLDTMHINQIASYISEKICNAFPDLNLLQSDLFIQISRLDMYTAHFEDHSSAKYVYGNNSIYFSEDLDFNNIDITAIHECIHYLQEYKDQKGKLIKLGLYDLTNKMGLALNEAAVQLVACRTLGNTHFENVTYYGMNFTSESPEYYPLECALVSQMTFFTGDDALYFSTLYSSSMFERNFANVASAETFFDIQDNLDKLLEIETELAVLTQKYQNSTSSIEKSAILQKQIDSKKKAITNVCIKIQNKIIDNCFKKKFLTLETYDDIREFENELVEFRKYLIIPENYTYYDEFCAKMTQDISFRKDQIIKYGKPIDIPKDYGAYLPVVVTTKKLNKLQEVIQTLKAFIFGE